MAAMCLALLWAGLGAAASAGPQAPRAGGRVPGQVIVRWREGVPQMEAEELLAASGARILREVKDANLALVAVPEEEQDRLLRTLADDPRVAYAEPNHWLYACGVPNDPHWNRQWNMTQIQAPGAWDVVTGTQQVVIALVDTGVDQDHPEFAGRVLPGYDYVNGDADPEDDNGHGTHAAGIALARGNNALGVAGVNWNARLLPLKVLDATGRGTYFDTVSAIYYATNQGARIVSLSLGGSDPSQSLHDAVVHATQSGALVFAAVGNDGGPVLYPAAYEEAIAVAATSPWDE
ncbi:MAG: S8 family serine peptidase, partial [Anaerolineae bacterium]|nr:S8 family serine peptidase [Anaerolineae bacterium]